MRCLPLADDCGVSASTVSAIMRCIDAGALCGTSIMARGEAVEAAAAELGRRMAGGSAPGTTFRPALRAGVHLNLLEGLCAASPQSVPLLADEQGVFRHSLGTLCRELYTMSRRNRFRFLDQVTLEWLAQVATVHGLLKKATGWEEVPLYLDGHQHVHAIPALRPALDAVLGSLRAMHVRVPEELRYACPAPPVLFAAGTLRRELLAFWGRSLRAFLATRHIPAPDYCIGMFCSGSLTLERLAAGLAKTATIAADDTVVEIMTHPGMGAGMDGTPGGGTPGKDAFSRFYASPARDVEREMLLSPEYRHTLAKYDPAWHHG